MPSTSDQRIDILLKEYETLRTEILDRVKARFTAMGLFGAVVGYVLVNLSQSGPTQAIPPWVFWTFGGIGFAAVLAVWFRYGQNIWRCSIRLGDIEERINLLAEENDLLVWEGRINQKHVLQPWFHEKFYTVFPKGDIRYRDDRDYERGLKAR